ncbi:hypothetical protein AAC387_Pa07g3394 [Persea americana]
MADPFTPTKPMPQRISLTSSPFLLTVSLSLASFSLYFLSFRDTTFWFLVSNAIIFLIAAADSETSSSSSSKHIIDLYEEYLKNTRSRNTYPTSLPQFKPQENKDSEDYKEMESSLPDHVPESSTTFKEKKDSGMDSFEEVKEKAMVAVGPSDDEDGGTVLDGGDFSALSTEELKDSGMDSFEEVKEKAMVAVGPSDDEDGGPVLDGGDFSALSTEELNKRVEDFITKFNREIWLQEIRERKRLKQI